MKYAPDAHLKSTERNNVYAREAQKVQIAGPENLSKIIKDSRSALGAISRVLNTHQSDMKSSGANETLASAAKLHT